jgi:hypothetical protein
LNRSLTNEKEDRMTVQTPAGDRAGEARYDYQAERGDGLVAFAGVMLMILGVMNFIYGIAAIDNANFYVRDAQFVFSDLNTYGWILTVVGTVQVLVALGIWARNGFSRWMGVLFASVNAVVQLLLIQAYPFWALAIFTLDILVIYALVVYGGRIEERA